MGANAGWERAKAAIGPKKCAVHMDMRGLFSPAAMADGCYDGANAEIDLSVCAELTDRLHRVYSSWFFFPSYFCQIEATRSHLKLCLS